MLLSRHQNGGQNHDIKIANRSFENVAHFKYLRATVSNQNSIQEDIKRKLNSGNAWYYSAQNLLSSRLLSNNAKIRIIKTTILAVGLYCSETWSLTLREEQRLRTFENRMLRRIFWSRRDEVTEGWRKLHDVELHNLYPLPNRITTIKPRRMRWARHVARMGEKRNAYRILWESQKERDH
jgi:hypothetical protein